MFDIEGIFSRLNNAGVLYLVAGGMAVNFYGIERATADIDLLLDLLPENLHRFIPAAKDMGLRPKAPVSIDDLSDEARREEWNKEKGMIVFSLYDPLNPFYTIDIFIREMIDFDMAYNERALMKAGMIEIPVVSIDTLIRMKESAGRPIDKSDVYYLKLIREKYGKTPFIS